MKTFKQILREFAPAGKKGGDGLPDKKQHFMKYARQVYAHHQAGDRIAAQEGYSGEAADKVDEHYEKADQHFGEIKANHGYLFKHLDQHERDQVYHNLAQEHPDKRHSQIYDDLKAGKKIPSVY